ncbi:NUDIX domain-containing protein [Lacticaseibacillus camelliae]|nr:NUDIX domain-containing protein [Lacticaseibacillus camelliae]
MTTLAHPLITITNIIWSFDPATKQVNVLLIKRSDQPFAGYWALPETAMREGESAHEAALRLVREKIGLRLDAGYAEQLATFTAADRDPSERALSLSYMIYLPQRPPLVPGPGASDAEWFALSRQPGGIFTFNYQRLRFYSLKADEYLTDQTPTTGLAFDHNWILTVACSRIRNKLDYQPTILFILGDSFTLKQARLIFAEFGRIEPDNSNFLRNHAAMLKPTGVTAKAGVGRPSKTYVLTLR